MAAPLMTSGGIAKAVSVESKKPVLAAWPAVLSVAIAALAGWFAFAVMPTNVDVAWLLVVCDRLLDGAELHVDIVEVNPPFSIWLYMPFAVAGRLTGLPAELWLSVGLPFFALGSVWLSARILHRSGLADRRSAWLAPAVIYVLLGLFLEDFGQREQFATIALLPWLALLAGRLASEGLKAGTTAQRIVGGMGAAMFVITKPPLGALALLVPALFVSLRRRSLRAFFTTESILGAVVTLAYVGWLAAFHLSFFVDLMPLLRDFYLPVRAGVGVMIASAPVKVFAMIAIATCAVARSGRFDPAALVTLLAAIGYVPVFVLMGKGWPYQALPFLLLGMIAFMLQLRRLPSLAEIPLLSKAGLALGVVAGLILVQAGQPFSRIDRRVEIEQAAAAIEQVVKRPVVANIGTELQSGHPLTRMIDGDYRMRYPALWMVDNAEGQMRGADLQEAARLTASRDGYIRQAVEDIRRTRPDIILDAGTKGTRGQAVVHENAGMAAMLSGYATLYRDRLVTVLIRSDLLSPARASSPVS